MQLKVKTIALTFLAAATAANSQTVDAWFAGVTPCVRDCLIAAAQLVGCSVYDRICICAHKTAFLAAARACIRANCPTVSTADPFNLVCPIIDPPPPITLVAV